MPGATLLTRVPRHFVNTLTFTGATGFPGDTGGAFTVATVTGRVLITQFAAYCSTTLVGATATVELGVASNTGGLIPITTATLLIATEFWNDATPSDVDIADAITDMVCGANIIQTTGTADVTAGVVEISFFWLPLSIDGNLA